MQIQLLIDYISSIIELSEANISMLQEHISERTYLKNQFILQQGDTCKHTSFIVSGATKTFYIDQEGNDHVYLLGVENWWVADLGSFITQSPADYNIQCLEKTTVFQISYDNLQLLYLKIPKFERLFRIIIERALVASQKRIVRNQSLPSKERYLLFCKEYPNIEQRVPQYLIASYLGITKQFLSKIRAELTNN